MMRILCVILLFVSSVHPLWAQSEAAAWPRQELGSRPPVLKGFPPLTEAELQEGWIRLFDGFSLYGWQVMAGKYFARNGLLINDQNNAGIIKYTSRFGNSVVKGERRLADGRGEWAPFELSLSSSKLNQAAAPDITLDSGQFRNVKLLPKAMKPIFDGKTLDGWTLRQKDGATVEAKIVRGSIQLTGGPGSLESDGKYDDFVLQLEYWTDAPVNSGVFFRCIPGELMNGYECQVFNNPPAEDYKKFMGTDTGGIFRRQVGRNVGAKNGQWNHLTIFAREGQISTWVNGIQTADWYDERDADSNPRKGRRLEAGTIQFQGHDPKTEIWFRNIRIGEL